MIDIQLDLGKITKLEDGTILFARKLIEEWKGGQDGSVELTMQCDVWRNDEMLIETYRFNGDFYEVIP